VPAAVNGGGDVADSTGEREPLLKCWFARRTSSVVEVRSLGSCSIEARGLRKAVVVASSLKCS
jgi:hypothetical protein